MSVEVQLEPEVELETVLHIPLCDCHRFGTTRSSLASSDKKQEAYEGVTRLSPNGNTVCTIDELGVLCHLCDKPLEAPSDMWEVRHYAYIFSPRLGSQDFTLYGSDNFRVAFRLEVPNDTVRLLSGWTPEDAVREHFVYQKWLSGIDSALLEHQRDYINFGRLHVLPPVSKEKELLEG